MRYLKLFMLAATIILLSGCTLPFQSDKYPAWNTNGLIDGKTLEDGRIVEAYQGLSINEVAHTRWLDFIIQDVTVCDTFETYRAADGKKLVVASIEVTNISDSKQKLSLEDFPLMWNLEKEEASYTYSFVPDIENVTFLTDNLVIDVGETVSFKTIYEVDDNLSKPFAIYYGEIYSDDLEGNSYYVYVR